MNNDKKALKSGIWYTVANYLVKSIGFITTPIFARLLSQAEFGAFNNYSSWLEIITIIVTLNLQSTLISAKYDFKDNFDEYIFSILVLSTFSISVWFVLLNIFNNVVSSLFGLSRIYINSMLIYLLFQPAINLFLDRERYFYEYKKTVTTSLILAVCTAVISVFLVITMEDRIAGRIFGSIIPTVVVGFFFYVYFIKKGKKIKFTYWKYALPICLPYIPHLLSMTLLNSTDRIMINKWCGSEATALYSLAYSCGAMITILLNSVNNAFSPWLAEKLTENKIGDIRKFSRLYIGGFLFCAIGIMLVSPEVLLIIGGEQYMDAIYVMTPVTMGCICQFLYTLFVNVEQYKKKTTGMAIASAIAALVNLGLNYIFIPSFGYLAAAYTTLVGYLCLLCIHMFLVWRIKLSCVYNYGFVGFVIIISLVSMILITLSYSNNMVRFFAIGVYCVIGIFLLFRFKGSILRLFRNR